MSSSRMMNITPEVAASMLEHNYMGNRRVRFSCVHQLAEVMRSGRFVADNGQTIVLGEDGTLYDGQHRLHAIVESGCAQRILVVRVRGGEDVYDTIDNGTKRVPADFLSGMPNREKCAAYGKVMACVERGDAPLSSSLQGKMDARTHVDRGTVLSYCRENADAAQTAVREGMRMRRVVECGPVTAYACFLGIVRYVGRDALIDEFVDDFLLPVSDNKTVAAAKQMVMRMGVRGERISYKWLVGTLLDAYRHFCELDESTMLNKQTTRIKEYSELIDAERVRRRHAGSEVRS